MIKQNVALLCSNVNSKAERIINEMDISDVFESICSNIISKKEKHLGEVSCWLID